MKTDVIYGMAHSWFKLSPYFIGNMYAWECSKCASVVDSRRYSSDPLREPDANTRILLHHLNSATSSYLTCEEVAARLVSSVQES
jgi:hypothetical protein